jgi:hypothetical protein
MGGISSITNNKKYLKKDLDIWIFLLIFKYKIKVMEKEFVPYEQALDLKELGFDEPCMAQWNDSNGFDGFGGNYRNSYFNYPDQIAAPLYQQAFRWLLILVNKNKHFSNKWTISYNEDYYSLFLGGCNMGVFEAELECLKKLIEIVKQSQKVYDESPHSKTFRTPASDYNSRGGYRK